MSVLIRGGRVITPTEDIAADVLIEGETVSEIGPSLQADASTVIQATGKYVLPGGVDPHTHIASSYLDVSSADDFTSGTVAAAFGGTTTLIEFCEPALGQSIPAALATWRQKLVSSQPVIDVGFHVIVNDLGGGALETLRGLRDEGITSYKVFMAFRDAGMLDDEALFRVMQVAAETGALQMVHAENGGVIEVLVEQAVAAGKRTPRYHAVTRPVKTEAEATNRAIELASIAGCGLYVVHVSSAEALDTIGRARALGQPVWGETCPHYLLFDDGVLDLPQFEGAKYVYSPPPRPKEHQEALWRALANDVLSVVSTDHAPYPIEGGKSLGRDDFSKIAPGVPGVEERLMLLHTFGVRRGLISLQRMVELVSTNPAKLFGLFPGKGTLAVGSDADIVVFDPAQPRTLTNATLHSRCDYSLYEGMQVVGVPETVLLRGRPVILEQEFVAEASWGRFIARTAEGHGDLTDTASTQGGE